MSHDELWLFIKYKFLKVDLDKLSYDELLIYQTLLNKLTNKNNTNTNTTSNDSLENTDIALSIINNQNSLQESNNSSESLKDPLNILLPEFNIFDQSTIDPTLIDLLSSNNSVLNTHSVATSSVNKLLEWNNSNIDSIGNTFVGSVNLNIEDVGESIGNSLVGSVNTGDVVESVILSIDLNQNPESNISDYSSIDPTIIPLHESNISHQSSIDPSLIPLPESNNSVQSSIDPINFPLAESINSVELSIDPSTIPLPDSSIVTPLDIQLSNSIIMNPSQKNIPQFIDDISKEIDEVKKDTELFLNLPSNESLLQIINDVLDNI